MLWQQGIATTSGPHRGPPHAPVTRACKSNRDICRLVAPFLVTTKTDGVRGLAYFLPRYRFQRPTNGHSSSQLLDPFLSTLIGPLNLLPI